MLGKCNVKYPFAIARNKWSVGDQILRLNFPPLPKQSQFGILLWRLNSPALPPASPVMNYYLIALVQNMQEIFANGRLTYQCRQTKEFSGRMWENERTLNDTQTN